MKLSDVVKPFNGEGDICAWLQKVELVAKLTKVSDLATFIPLYLEGSALSVYLELSDADKEKSNVITRKLLDAFSDSRFVAYNKLKAAQWTGESVDVFANNLRRMGRDSGFTGDGLEEIVKLAFVTGFPEHISVELQQVQGIEEMKVSEIMAKARVLSNNLSAKGLVAAGQGLKMGAGKKTDRGSLKCFNCQGPHLMRDCPERKTKVFKCFRCGEEGHIASRCEARLPRQTGNRQESSGAESCAAGSSGGNMRSAFSEYRVPVIMVTVNGRECQALVDTGCTSSLVKSEHVAWWNGESNMVAFDGHSVKCRGVSTVPLVVAGVRFLMTMTVVDEIVGGIDAVIGMDAIQRLGGVIVQGDRVQFGNVGCAVQRDFNRRSRMSPEAHVQIKDSDFEAWFDGKRWTVRYFWKTGTPPTLTNNIAQYDTGLNEEEKQEFDKEVDRWIDEGILVPWTGEVNGIIPLMGVVQETKKKIRPVMDFGCELNNCVESHTGGEVLDVCNERLREWRRIEGEAEIVDLKSAYLQLHVSPELWQYQLVRYHDKMYALTRLGFGLNSAPKIMSKILKTVLEKESRIAKATSSYIDDIMVDVSKVRAKDVIEHLEQYGLVTKPPEKLEKATVLGLKLGRNQQGELMFSRANEVPAAERMKARMTKREVFSVCGKLVGHYPVAGWLRVACSFVKRQAEGNRWDDYAGDRACTLLKEVVERVHVEDPIKGRWKVGSEIEGIVWCDASDLALGVAVEIGGDVVEDATWLRKKDDHNHINVAELEAALKGLNLGLQWGLKKIRIITDSETVRGWIEITLSEEKKVKTKGAAEMLVKRRLGVLKSLVEEFDLKVEVLCVPSSVNKADKLTRVSKGWLQGKEGGYACAGVCDVKRLHELHHFGVERSWFLAKQVDPTVSKKVVKKVVQECMRCQSIDPASGRHDSGELNVGTNWTRLAIDVTHYKGLPYLSMLDCGPGRFAIWRELRTETAHAICKELDQVFLERGAVEEVLMDNATAFRSREMNELLAKWGVQPYYRAAYRPSGNGIVERNHRTVKAVAEKSGVNPMEAVYWYNMSPRNGQDESSIPHRAVYKYNWRHPMTELCKDDDRVDEGQEKLRVNDEVWVKPPNARCTSQWGRGQISKVVSRNTVEVDGIPRHVLDVRPVVTGNVEEQSGVDDPDADDEETRLVEERYPRRERRAPFWASDYVM